jgi:hypothetical protein
MLTRWLFGSGRYRAYIWALVAGDPELARLNGHAASAKGEGMAAARRAALAKLLSRRLADHAALASELWDELDFLQELDAELMRWHAISNLAHRVLQSGQEVSPAVLGRVREEVAIAHGLTGWAMLAAGVVDGRLWGRFRSNGSMRRAERRRSRGAGRGLSSRARDGPDRRKSSRAAAP